jgi:transcriptional regulator with XRE-family HTH domain
MMKNKMSAGERRAFVEELAVASIALAMAEAIHNSGMSQREIAERLGITEARISQILGATGNPTIKTLARLADVLGRELRVEFSSEVHVPGQGAEWQVVEGVWNGTVSSEDESSDEEQYVAVAA